MFKFQVAVDEELRHNGLATAESAGLTPLSTKNVKRLSERMRNLEPLDAPVIEKWVRYWLNAGL